MRRIEVVVIAVCALITASAVLGADTKMVNFKKSADQTVYASTLQTDSPLVRAAKISYQARMHPRSRVVIDSTTLVVSSRWSQPAATPTAAASGGPESQGRSWASGNSSDAAVIAAREKSEQDQRNAAEQARLANLRQEQSYMATQNDEPYSEVIDDHVTKRLETIPDEMKKPPR